MTSQSNSISIAARCCLTEGAAGRACSVSMHAARWTGSTSDSPRSPLASHQAGNSVAARARTPCAYSDCGIGGEEFDVAASGVGIGREERGDERASAAAGQGPRPRSCGEFDQGHTCGFSRSAQVAIERGERQAAALGKFEIGGVVDGQAMSFG